MNLRETTRKICRTIEYIVENFPAEIAARELARVRQTLAARLVELDEARKAEPPPAKL